VVARASADEGEARVAARMALSELMSAAAAIRTVSNVGTEETPEWVREIARFPLWKEHRAVLALTLDSSDWGKVEAAFIAAEGRILDQYQAWEKRVTEGMRVLSAPAGRKQPPALPPSG
jgi:hypothetical protein